MFDTKWLCNWPYSCDIHNNDWIFSKTIKCFPNHQNNWHAASLISNTQNNTEKNIFSFQYRTFTKFYLIMKMTFDQIRLCSHFDINCEIMSTKWNKHEMIEYEYKWLCISEIALIHSDFEKSSEFFLRFSIPFTIHKSDFCHGRVTDNLSRCMIARVRD